MSNSAGQSRGCDSRHAQAADRQFCDAILGILLHIDIRHINSYIACLSAERDQLGQWRAYTQDGGVSIGFDRLALEQLAG